MNKELKNKGATSFEGEVVALKGVIRGRVTWYNQGTVVYPNATGTVTATGAILPREITVTSKVISGEKGILTEVPVSPEEVGYVRGNFAVSAKFLKEALASNTEFDPSKGANVEVPVLVNPTLTPVTSKNGQVYKTWELLRFDGQRAINLQKAKAVPGWSNIEASAAGVKAAMSAFWGDNAPKRATFPTIQVAEWDSKDPAKSSGQEVLDQADDE